MSNIYQWTHSCWHISTLRIPNDARLISNDRPTKLPWLSLTIRLPRTSAQSTAHSNSPRNIINDNISEAPKRSHLCTAAASPKLASRTTDLPPGCLCCSRAGCCTVYRKSRKHELDTEWRWRSAAALAAYGRLGCWRGHRGVFFFTWSSRAKIDTGG